MLTAVSLCAGVGGIDLALQRSGVHVVAAVELKPERRNVLRRHFPDTALFPDLTKVTGDQLRDAGLVPDRGIIAAGWPCQGNSVAGRRAGMADPRSGLWRHVVRILAETRPRWFLGENVPGLLSVNNGRDMATCVRDLDELGYGVAWRILDAQFFGIPQRRRRVIFVGCLGDGAAPVQVLFEPESGTRDPAARAAEGTRVAATLTAGAHRPGVPAPGRRGEDDHNLVTVSTLQSGGANVGWRLDAEAAAGHQLIPMPRQVVMALTADGIGTCGPDDNQAQAGHLIAVPIDLRNATRDSGATGVGTPGDVSEDGTGRGTLIVPYGVGLHGETSDGGHVSATVTGSNGQPPGVIEDTAVRRLTPLECERLQGFPDDWTRHGLTEDGRTVEQKDSPRYEQIGDAVAVPVLAWVARHIVAVDQRMRKDGAA